MSNDRLKKDLIHQLNCLANNVDEKFGGMTVDQVHQLEAAIEAVWAVVCRRKK